MELKLSIYHPCGNSFFTSKSLQINLQKEIIIIVFKPFVKTSKFAGSGLRFWGPICPLLLLVLSPEYDTILVWSVSHHDLQNIITESLALTSGIVTKRISRNNSTRYPLIAPGSSVGCQ